MKNNAGSDPLDNPNQAKRDSFATKVAVVTGPSRGIGLALAKRLIANGYRVVANSRNIGSAMTLQNTTDLKLVDGDYCTSGDREASSRHRGPEFWEN